ncbi:MAG: hypothetical protein QM755_00845 [Luteolibacter sp.]
MDQQQPSHRGIKLYRVVLWIVPFCLALAISRGWDWAFPIRRFPRNHPPGWLAPMVLLFMLAAMVAMGFWDARLSGKPSPGKAALKYTVIQCVWLLVAGAAGAGG